MATQAQINANRRNAQKSTGPKTAEGKGVVSQNAFKHGLFAHEAVIRGESADEFDLHREVLLADLKPVGAMESMLAERIVSLSWRLLRAERLQNQAIDEKILGSAGGPVARVGRSLLPKGVIRTLTDSGVMEPEPSLARIFAKDSLDAWFLDRLLLYERRIETSMFRTIQQLRDFQKRREAQQAHPAEEQPLSEARAATHDSESKNQTQSAPVHKATKPSGTKDYSEILAVGAPGNKANLSQSHRPEGVPPCAESEIATARQPSQ